MVDTTCFLLMSLLAGNTARDEGGGFYASTRCTVNMVDSRVSGNQALDQGGGGFAKETILTLSRSKVEYNKANDYGGQSFCT